MSILVVTYSEDNESVADVIARLRDAGQHVFRLDTDRFPLGVRLATVSTDAGLHTSLASETDAVDLRTVRAVWYRRDRVGRGLPWDMDDDPGRAREIREVAIREARTALFGAIDGLDCFKMDPFWTIRRASQKPLQLALAPTLGLRTPPTLITNDPAAVRAFAAEHGALIFKPVSDIAVGDNYPVDRVWTNRMTPEELEDLEGLEYSPMIFQQEVPKALEIRATVVGGKVYAASVDPSIVGADDDWRKEGVALNDKWSAFDFPPELEARLLQMMTQLGLQYGAADFILTPQEEYYFLEVNPVGEFCWLDKLTSLPLQEAITEALLAGATGQ